MAVVNLKSNALTNRDATPKVLTDALISGGSINHSYGWVFTGAADSAASNYRLASVPSSAQLTSLEWVNGSLGSACLLDVAAWYPTNFQSGGGAFLAQSLTTVLISSSTFSTLISGTIANTTFSQLMTTAGTQATPNYWEQPLWALLGLASDPECVIDLGFSVRVAVANAGYVGMKASFSF
jgi:hypothetical protein